MKTREPLSVWVIPINMDHLEQWNWEKLKLQYTWDWAPGVSDQRASTHHVASGKARLPPGRWEGRHVVPTEVRSRVWPPRLPERVPRPHWGITGLKDLMLLFNTHPYLAGTWLVIDGELFQNLVSDHAVGVSGLLCEALFSESPAEVLGASLKLSEPSSWVKVGLSGLLWGHWQPACYPARDRHPAHGGYGGRDQVPAAGHCRPPSQGGLLTPGGAESSPRNTAAGEKQRLWFSPPALPRPPRRFVLTQPSLSGSAQSARFVLLRCQVQVFRGSARPWAAGPTGGLDARGLPTLLWPPPAQGGLLATEL